MRTHYWQFLIDETGAPIPNAEVSIYLAGTDTPLYIYRDEIGGSPSNETPQVITNAEGFFQFWVADASEINGYEPNTKMKIAWERTGIAQGYIDFIDIFVSTIPVDETDTSVIKNKALSNYLANLWETHRLDVSHKVHGIDEVNLEDTDPILNRLISNELGKKWEDHSTYSFGTSAISAAHGLEAVDINDNDTRFNKLVSNDIIRKLYGHIETIDTGSWTVTGSEYYYDITHNLDEQYPVVSIYDSDEKKQIEPAEIISLGIDNIRILVSDNINANVKIKV